MCTALAHLPRTHRAGGCAAPSNERQPIPRTMHPSRRSTLELLADYGSASASEVAAAFGWSLPRAAMLLLRARRHGLVQRARGAYRVSPRGHARLDWLRDHDGRR
jgi:hypothetical protein